MCRSNNRYELHVNAEMSEACKYPESFEELELVCCFCMEREDFFVPKQISHLLELIKIYLYAAPPVVYPQLLQSDLLFHCQQDPPNADYHAKQRWFPNPLHEHEQ